MSDYAREKELPDSRMAAIMPLTFGRARIVVGSKNGWLIGPEEGY